MDVTETSINLDNRNNEMKNRLWWLQPRLRPVLRQLRLHVRAVFCGLGACLVALASLVMAQTVDADGRTLETLAGIRPPEPTGTEDGRPVTLDDYVRDRAALLVLGKALFWDTAVGSDGRTACASCHFHAGTNHRFKNTLNPGQAHTVASQRQVFNPPQPGLPWGPNHRMQRGEFPLHKLSDVLDRNSVVLSTTDDVVGAAGVFDRLYKAAGTSRFDRCVLQDDPVFRVGDVVLRQVTARETPTTINAALNVRNFWDGRANEIFNGFSPLGLRDPDAGIWVTTAPGGAATKARLALRHSSAASQAVGPPTSGIEMSCGGRTFADIARRVLNTTILARQQIHANDSVLAAYADAARPLYAELIQAAFQPRLWNSPVPVSFEPGRADAQQYSQMEANFTLFFGLAIQAYESTLISDQAPLDRYLTQGTGLGAAEVRGMAVFLGKGSCINCHNGPELTSAATRLRQNAKGRVERMRMGDEQLALYDSGFYNIGVRPTVEDLGVGATDPWGNPLSLTRQYRTLLSGGSVPDRFEVDVCSFDVPLSTPCDPSQRPDPSFRDAVDGAFKTPTLRNIALTGPYFHNGSRATLEQVVEFYNRGGDRRDIVPGSDSPNTTRFGPNPSNLDADIKQLNLTAQEKADLVAFLKNALTDPRVAWERAPFDHPSLVIRDGHVGNESVVDWPDTAVNPPYRGIDETHTIGAVGRNGRSANKGPLRTFEAGLAAPSP